MRLSNLVCTALLGISQDLIFSGLHEFILRRNPDVLLVVEAPFD
jgi:hypothetical protein